MFQLRRTGPLLAAFFLCLFVLAIRLYEIQVDEHDIWAGEAAKLSRHSEVVPHIRGQIHDRHGRVLVRDEDAYELEFVWRDFRREHPLGIVAKAWSLLAGRPVPLQEARESLVPMGIALTLLSPDDLRDFANGEGLTFGGQRVLPADAGSERARKEAAGLLWRDARAGEAEFYVHQLLNVTKRETRALKQLDKDAWSDKSFLQRVAQVREAYRGRPSDARLIELEIAVETRLAGSMEHLQQLALAVSLDLTEDEREVRAERYLPLDDPKGFIDPLGALVADIEHLRQDVEDATADRLFREATGFSSARLSPENLMRLDLDWLRRTMQWDAARLHDWCVARGDAFSQGSPLLAAYVFAQVKNDPRVRGRKKEHREVHETLLDCLAEPFYRHARRPGDASPSRSWRTVEDPIVLTNLPELLERGDELERSMLVDVLDFEDEELRALPYRSIDTVMLVLSGLRDVPPFNLADHHLVDPTQGGRSPRKWTDHINGLADLMVGNQIEYGPDQLETVESALLAWDFAFQERIAQALDACEPPVALRKARIKGAQKEREHLIKDYSTRPRRLMRSPGYDLVQLISRYPAEHAGFHVRTVTRRVAVTTDDGLVRRRGIDFQDPNRVLLARSIVGSVRPPSLVHVLESSFHKDERRRLEAQPEWTQQERETLEGLGSREMHESDRVGSLGAEAAFDQVLSGSSGYRATGGLTERAEGRGLAYRAPRDGQDVWLTLDTDLQLHAQQTLERPRFGDKADVDQEWIKSPVGGLFLMTVKGEVLVAASAPSRHFEEEEDWILNLGQIDDQRLHPTERIFLRPLSTPPGSTMKPLVAWWAMSTGLHGENGLWHLDPNDDSVTCVKARSDFNRHVRCHGYHSDHVDLRRALLHSCNAYFAYLGRRGSTQDFRDMVRTYGMLASTGAWGVDDSGAEDEGDSFWKIRMRHEDTNQFNEVWKEPTQGFGEQERELFANGLSVFDASPAHLGRAYAALATGTLPQLRLVRRVGDTNLTDEPGTDLTDPDNAFPLSELHRKRIADLLVDVVNVSGASANGRGLSEPELGFQLACKTGSADYSLAKGQEGEENPKMRKRTWLAGWFPAEDPQYVIVAYVHDTSVTSSKSAVHLASQFLADPVLKKLVRFGPDGGEGR
tara:strand:- start:6783 stop:10190 length:3408 start_codon:yes stop_codon:yes gene_type:complete